MRIIGTCGSCGGPVTIPNEWMSILPPVPTCQSCGKKPKNKYGTLIKMEDE
ncbi:MAG: hypothetical protein V4509_01770 [Patescibacteria group bacterium]